MAIEGLGERIREERIKLGLSQKELAERVGVKENAISSYETGGATPPAQTLSKLAVALKCSADYLLGLERHKTIQVDGLDNETHEALATIIKRLQGK